MVSRRKPYNNLAGYVCSLKCRLGGSVVVLDRREVPEVDADERWVLMHMPSTRHVAVRTLAHARDAMKGVARAATRNEAARHADILPVETEPMV